MTPRMYSVSTVVFLCFAFSVDLLQAGNDHDHIELPVAVVAGAVYCNVCMDSFSSKPVPGASVAVECKNLSFRQEVKTNSNGEFRILTPFPNAVVKECSVRLISSNEPSCSVPATALSSSLRLKPGIHGSRIFSPGILAFRPVEHPQACNEKPSTNNFNDNAHNELPSNSNHRNKIAQQLVDNQQPIMPSQLPPQNPVYPPFTFPPYPFQGPPSFFPPNPPNFQPPPTTYPPFTPPLGYNFPPVPGGVVGAPAPPQPSFPFPFPPFGFQPAPGFPGAPPAVGFSSSSP